MLSTINEFYHDIGAIFILKRLAFSLQKEFLNIFHCLTLYYTSLIYQFRLRQKYSRNQFQKTVSFYLY